MTLQMCIGFITAALGVIIIKYGDRDLTKGKIQGGIILKLFSHSYLNPKVLKWQRITMRWGIGLAVLWIGIWLMFDY